MATKKKKPDYTVREPTADDAIELLGILGAAGIDAETGRSVGLAIAAMQSDDARSREVMVQAAATAITSGLSSALRDREARAEARNFLYSIWTPKLSVKEGQTYEDAKHAAWAELPMRGPFEIGESLSKTENFADFLAFFTDMLPGESTGNSSGNSTTPSSETSG